MWRAGYGLSRVATGFLPIEDQGYLLATVQLPDGASLERTNEVLDRAATIARKTAGVDTVLSIAGVSALDNNASLSSSGVLYIILKDWDARGKNEQLLPLFTKLNGELDQILEAKINVLPPPPIQGIGNAGGFTMQVQLRDGSFDFSKLQAITNTIVTNAQSQSGLQRVQTSFRADVPQVTVDVDRVKAQTLFVPVDAIFQTIGAYLGSSYVAQFNKFGRTFQVYVQADSNYRLRPDDIDKLTVRNEKGDMIPLGSLVTMDAVGRPLADHALQSLSVLDDHRAAGARLLLRRSDGADGADRRPHAAAGCVVRMDRDVLSGEGGRQSALHRVRARDAAGLSRARRSV